MRPKGYFWNDERDQTIRDIFLGSTALSTSQLDRLIAEKLGTTAAAVSTRRTAIGVKSANPNAHRGGKKKDRDWEVVG